MWKYNAYNYDEVLVGYDKMPHGEPNEPVFRYSVRMPVSNWFCQKKGNIYWFSVLAVYDINEPIYPWGWTNHEHMFNDDAAAWEQAPGGEWNWVPLKDQTEETEDMSFILFTDKSRKCWCYPCFFRGDATGDCKITTGDSKVLQQAWPGLGGTYNPCADFNKDGKITTGDSKILQKNWPGLGGPGCIGVPGCP